MLVACSNPDYRLLAAGCLAHPTDIRAASLLNTLAATKHKVRLTHAVSVTAPNKVINTTVFIKSSDCRLQEISSFLLDRRMYIILPCSFLLHLEIHTVSTTGDIYEFVTKTFTSIESSEDLSISQAPP